MVDDKVYGGEVGKRLASIEDGNAVKSRHIAVSTSAIEEGTRMALV